MLRVLIMSVIAALACNFSVGTALAHDLQEESYRCSTVDVALIALPVHAHASADDIGSYANYKQVTDSVQAVAQSSAPTMIAKIAQNK